MKLVSFNLPSPYEIRPVGGMPTGGVGKLEDIIQVGITILFILATLLALAFLIWGGIAWASSEGDKTKVEGARKRLTYAILGLVVVFSSFLIISVIENFFNIKLFAR